MTRICYHSPEKANIESSEFCVTLKILQRHHIIQSPFKSKRLVRTVLIFTESSDQLSRATDRVPGLPASPGYVQ
ncbi:hypothetical protein E2A72_19485 [Salmonella enterica]|nr:hypothetical protein [Salmonella enterica]EAW1149420.1 hypothetical protein [Salmonella enterica subsp. houtenae]EAW2233280.1 hypothetical protein [Salmonella enterica subsp. enterica]EBI0041894.1 hypothetical protein [Salmonella enterica subsp. diarizonae serovar 61:k:z35]EDU0972637.1 hypothetical protein [Salmonella enterica subsp. arizonae serovar 38:z4,z23:-]